MAPCQIQGADPLTTHYILHYKSAISQVNMAQFSDSSPQLQLSKALLGPGLLLHQILGLSSSRPAPDAHVPLHRVPVGRIAPTALAIEGGANGPRSCALGTTSGMLGTTSLPMFLNFHSLLVNLHPLV